MNWTRRASKSGLRAHTRIMHLVGPGDIGAVMMRLYIVSLVNHSLKATGCSYRGAEKTWARS